MVKQLLFFTTFGTICFIVLAILILKTGGAFIPRVEQLETLEQRVEEEMTGKLDQYLAEKDSQLKDYETRLEELTLKVSRIKAVTHK